MKPEVGDLVRACDLPELSGSYGRRLMIWAECESCKKTRWVETRNRRPLSRWCFPCGRREGKRRGSGAREKHPRWKGGRHVTALGYIQVTPPLDHPLLAQADCRGRVYEHRWVMACALGRLLSREEEVHHKNGDKHDNRIENLELTSKSEHIAQHHREVRDLRARVAELEAQLEEKI